MRTGTLGVVVTGGGGVSVVVAPALADVVGAVVPAGGDVSDDGGVVGSVGAAEVPEPSDVPEVADGGVDWAAGGVSSGSPVNRLTRPTTRAITATPSSA